MANGKIRFGKQSGGELALIIPDGVDNTEVIVPESGILATKQYVDDNVLLSPNDSRVKTALNASGEAPIYACRAWVNFNGTGTVSIRASGNVSSITYRAVGKYIVNTIEALPENISLSSITGFGGTADNVIGSFTEIARVANPIAATSLYVNTGYIGTSYSASDNELVCVSVFG